mgnify:FL=1
MSIKIYDVLGKELKTLVNEVKTVGTYSTIWNGDDNFVNNVISGIYLYRIESGSFVKAKKMILLK